MNEISLARVKLFLTNSNLLLSMKKRTRLFAICLILILSTKVAISCFITKYLNVYYPVLFLIATASLIKTFFIITSNSNTQSTSSKWLDFISYFSLGVMLIIANALTANIQDKIFLIKNKSILLEDSKSPNILNSKFGVVSFESTPDADFYIMNDDSDDCWGFIHLKTNNEINYFPYCNDAKINNYDKDWATWSR